MPTEHEIQSTITRWLALHDHVRVFRQNTGAHKVGKHFVRYGVKGQADLRVIVGPEGWLWEIEVKTPTGRQSADQKAYEKMLIGLGGSYTLARCVEDAWRTAVERWPEHEWQTPASVL